MGDSVDRSIDKQRDILRDIRKLGFLLERLLIEYLFIGDSIEK